MAKLSMRRRFAGMAKVATALGACVYMATLSAPLTAQSHTSDPLAAQAGLISTVASRVRAEIARLPANSTVEQFEAAILFTADQGNTPTAVICAAFDQLYPDAAIPGNAKVAMRNVCRTLSLRRGTGAIPSGGGFGAPGFSAPVIGGGGGGSNYTSQF